MSGDLSSTYNFVLVDIECTAYGVCSLCLYLAQKELSMSIYVLRVVSVYLLYLQYLL
jgi:hypothetical protein